MVEKDNRELPQGDELGKISILHFIRLLNVSQVFKLIALAGPFTAAVFFIGMKFEV